MPQPMGTESHLCASQVIESAWSMPARFSLSSGERIAAPPLAAELGDIGQRIDDSCRGGARGADDQKRRPAVFAVLSHLAAQAIQVELQSAVGLDRANRTAPHPGHVCDLVEPVMRLTCEIERRRR